ncbi:hypothetical protein CHUAL_001281 [Chamberlinius hualienensis]
MALLWYHHGNVKVPNDRVHMDGVTIADKVYLFGIGSDGLRVITEMDLTSMKCGKFVTIKCDWSASLKFSGIHAYAEFLVLFFYESGVENPGKLVKISSVTREVQIFHVDYEMDNIFVIGDCIVEDNFYIYFNNSTTCQWSIFAINLKTLKRGLIKSTNSGPSTSVSEFTMVANGQDIYCLSHVSNIIFIFNTVSKMWTFIEDEDPCILDNDHIFQKLVIKGELVLLSAETRRRSKLGKRFALICNLNSKTCVRRDFVFPSSFRLRRIMYFEYDGKIVALKQSQKAPKRSHNEEKPETADFEVYILDLDPSLQSMCAMRAVKKQLDLGEVPQFIQDEHNRYLRE